MTDLEQLGYQFEHALLSLDSLLAKRIITQPNSSYSSFQLIEKVVVSSLQHIGEGWENGTIALSQVYMSGRICEKIVDEVLPPSDPNRKNQPKMAIAVLEDYHVLGKRIVYAVLRASGFELIDYGSGITVEDLVRRVQEDRIKILLISTLMLRSALRIREVRKQLEKSGYKVKIVVGGAPFLFDNLLWKEVKADFMGHNASESIELVSKAMGGA